MATKKKSTKAAKKAVKKAPAATEAPAATDNHIGQIVTVKVGEAEYKGLCTAERHTNSGAQIYLKLNSLVARFFNISNIVKVEEVV